MIRFQVGRRAVATLAATAAVGAGILVGTAAPAYAMDGATTVVTPSVFSSANKSAVAECPTGTSLFGAGGRIVDGLGEVQITDIEPAADLLSVRVEGGENGNIATDWQVIAYAICATPVADMEWVEAPSTDNGSSDSPRIAVAECPSGKSLYGGGYQLSGAAGQVFIDKFYPNSGLTEYLVNAYEDSSYAPNWDLYAYAICGAPVANMSVEYETSAYDAVDVHEAKTDTCPAGTVTGVGGNLVGNDGDLLMDRLTPNASLTRVTAQGQENSALGTSWAQDVYAICAGQ